MLRILCLGFVVCLLSFVSAMAQQPIQYSQYMQNKYLLNPAFGGLEGSLSVFGGIRSQWSQLQGSPKSQNVSAHLPMYNLQGSIGFSFQNETSSDFNIISMSGSYNYVIETTYGALSLGAKLGAHQLRIQGNGIITPSGTYEGNISDHNDPILISSESRGVGPLWGVGVYFMAEELEIGITLDEFPIHSIGAGEISYKRNQTTSLFAEYHLLYSNLWTFSPSIYIKSDFAQTQIDFFGKVNYSNLFGGLGLRGYSGSSLDALVILMGVQFNKHYKLSYSYDLGIS
ncbi:MAG: PorP/SprF family type IX secretion system membrane protein, partial [Saprospiraceae bacterium]